MRRVPGLILALCALTLAGCPQKLPPGECKADEDCRETPQTQVCINGFCKECRDDAQCKPGQVCKNNGCAAKAQCAEAKDCQAGQKCTAGKCVAECDEKTAEQDCGAGRRCIAGRCAAEEECVADADCGSGKACVNSVCKVQGGLSEAARNELLGNCKLKPVYFDFDEASLAKSARDTLDQDWQCLSRADFRRLQIAGHTDERGTTEYNLALGSRRAEAVRKYLASLGADTKKLHAVSYGKERPADPAHDDAAWSKNRRVELNPEQ
jgi:peptidoglycan-associated lipoprotein